MSPFRYLLCAALLVWSYNAFAVDYYFSTATGDDSRSFSEAQNSATPWRSIAKFNEIFTDLQPGDRVFFRRGEVYPGGLVLDNSGTQNSPITIGAYGDGAKPIISGFVEVSSWTSLGNGIYETNVLATGPKVNILVLNGTNYPKGRYPNRDEPYGGYLTMNAVDGNSITSNELAGSPNWNGGQLVLRTSPWVLERMPITSHSGNTINYSGSTVYTKKAGYGFFVQDHISTLDQYGEWYYNPATAKLSMYFGSQAPDAATRVQVSSIDNLADVRGSHLLLDGLTFEGANQYGIVNFATHVERLTVKSCDINFSGIDAVFFRSMDYGIVEDCRIRNSNNCGLKLFYSPNVTVRNNHISNTGLQAGMGADGDGAYTGILSEDAGFVAEYNQIINTGYIGLRFGSGDNLIKNNFVNNFCTVLNDGAGIYTYNSGGNRANRRVIGNIVLNGIGTSEGTGIYSDRAAEGIYIDDNTTDIEVVGNTAAWCASNGSFVHNSRNFLLKDNTFFNNRTQLLMKSDGFGHAISDGTITDNIYFSKAVEETVFFMNSDADDIGSLGTFDNNYYVRPMYNQLPLLVQYQNGSGVNIRQPFELTDWQSTFGHGQNSKKSPVEIPAYTINTLSGNNQIPNEGFNNDIGGTWCFSPYSDCAVNWVSGSPLDGGALQVSGPSPSRVGMNCGTLDVSKEYIVRFSAAADKAATVEIFFMQGSSPWATISPLLSVALGTERKEYEMLISTSHSEANGTIQFQFGSENTTYWLDNVQLYEADINATQADDYIRFEYNAGKTNKTVNLNDNYVDARNTAYSGTVVIPPYHALVLIKDINGTGEPGTDSDNDGIVDSQDQCPGFDDLVDSDSDGFPDGCDLCPGGSDALDSDNDGIPNDCDACPNGSDTVDSDNDGVADGCDVCPNGSDTADSDNDGIADGCDLCPGGNDTSDADGDGIPDACDQCPAGADGIDSDNDTVPDACDVCPGWNDTADTDGDGVPNGCDTTAVDGTGYYFSTEIGDDSRSFIEAQNPGTPWKTIAKFNQIISQLQPGDQVFFRRGEVFDGGLILNISGTPSAPITITAYDEGTKPVINGFIEAGDWTDIGNGIYESNALPTGATVNMVVLDGVNYAKGRYPNRDAGYGGYLTMNAVGSGYLTSEELVGSPNWNGGQVVIRTSHWTIERFPISSHSGTTINYDGTTVYSTKVGYGFFIQDHIGTLDQYGEWYYNPTTKKLAMYFGNQPPGATTRVQVSAVEHLAETRGNNLVLNSLAFEGANGSSIVNFDEDLERLSVLGCDINFSGIDAIFLKAMDYARVEDCNIRNSNSCGVKLFYSPHVTLRRNYIFNSGMQAGMGSDGDGAYTGILSEDPGFVAEYNQIINTGYIGLRFGSGDNLIKNNFVNTFCAVLDDGAGIYTYNSGGNRAGRKIIGNIILNGIGANEGTGIYAGRAAEGIYIDDNTSDIEVVGNTAAWCVSNGSFVHNSRNFLLENNTFFNNGRQLLVKSDGFGHALSEGTFTNNIYFAKEATETVFEITSDADDIGTLGSFHTNYYTRPLHNALPILVQYQSAAGVSLRQPYEIADWQSNFGHGTNAEKSPVELPGYTVNNLSSGNQIGNEGFNTGVSNVWCFSPYSDCSISWTSGSVLDGGALQISGPSPSRAGMNCGALDAAKSYILRFSAAASEPSGMEIFFMQGSSPWAIISPLHAVQLGTERRDYEILIHSSLDDAVGTLQFQFGGENLTYWLDNIQLYEADVNETSADDYIRFEYNAGQSNKIITLDGQYVDARNTAYSGSVLLPPYRSLVLIKDINGTGEPGTDEDNDGVPDNLDQCPGFDDLADADSDSVPDGCDQCPGFDDRLDEDADGIPDACDNCQIVGTMLCPNGDCPLDDDPIQNDIYYAEQQITSTGKIADEGVVSFKAGNRIILQPGFTATTGSSFRAEILTCLNAAVPVMNQEKISSIPKQTEMPEQDRSLKKDKEEMDLQAPDRERPRSIPKWKVYPSLVTAGHSELTVEYYATDPQVLLTIVDQWGRRLRTIRPRSEIGWNKISWPIGQLAPGMYYLYHVDAPVGERKVYPFVVLRR